MVWILSSNIFIVVSVRFQDHYYFWFVSMILIVQSDTDGSSFCRWYTSFKNHKNSMKRMNKQVEEGLQNLTNWLNANKICPNVRKTEVVLFKSSRKLTDFPLKLQLNGKRLYPINSVKYLGLKLIKT